MSTLISAGTSTSGAVINSDTSGSLQLQTGSTPTTAVTIDTAQNVGVGVTPSAWRTTSKATQIGYAGSLVASTATNNVYLGANWYINSTPADTYINNGYASLYQQQNGIHYWFNASSGTAGNAITFSQAMTLDNSGNLGVGKAASSFGGSYTGAIQWGTTGGGAVMSSGPNSYWLTNSYYTGSGYIYNQSSYSTVIACSENLGTVTIKTAASGTAGNAVSYTSGPYVANLGTSWTNASDERLKNITGLITNGLQSVNTLRAAKFTWKSDTTNKPQVGLIAQDLQKVLPEAVNEGYTVQDDETVYLGVAYTEVIPLLVAAIQELSAKVTALEAKVGA